MSDSDFDFFHSVMGFISETAGSLGIPETPEDS